MKLLVAGTAGFVVSHLAMDLLGRGDHFMRIEKPTELTRPIGVVEQGPARGR